MEMQSNFSPLYFQFDDRLQKVRSAVTTYILHHLPVGTLVAITEFESNAYLLAVMTNISSDTVRQNLISVLPTVPDGGTEIGAGIELCRQVKRSRTSITNRSC